MCVDIAMTVKFKTTEKSIKNLTNISTHSKLLDKFKKTSELTVFPVIKTSKSLNF